jgi:hypothetical protein
MLTGVGGGGGAIYTIHQLNHTNPLSHIACNILWDMWCAASDSFS